MGSKQSAYLHTHVGSLLGAGAVTTSTWTSGAFKYNGAAGRAAKKVKFVLRRRSDTSTLLGVAGNSATFTVDIINGAGKSVAQPVHHAALTQSTSWTKVGPRKIARNTLRRGNHYRFRIASTFVNGAEVIPGADADYALAKLIAKKHIHRH